MESRTESPILKAIRDRNIADLQKFLDCGIDMTEHRQGEQSPLSYACEMGAWDCVEVMAKSSKPNENNFFYYKMYINDAVVADQYEAAKALIEACEKNKLYFSRTYEFQGHYATHWAVFKRNIPMIKLLIQHFGQLGEKNNNNKTPMQFAASLGAYDCVDAIASLASTYDTYKGEKDVYQFGDALLCAVKDGQLKSVEKLLDAKAPLTWTTQKEKNSALHCAVINDDVNMVKLLLEKGASLTWKNNDGKTPFQLACDLGHFDCAELCFADKDKYTDVDGARYGGLLIHAITEVSSLELIKRLHQAAASLTARTRADKKTALHHAADRFFPDYAIFLLKCGASQTEVEHYDYTPIQEAANKKNWQVVKAMLDVYQGKKLSLQEMEDLHLDEVLLQAIIYNEYTIVKSLLELGVPCNKTSPMFGNIALTYAAMYCKNNPDIVTLLLEFGADPNIRNRHGKTVIDTTRECRNLPCLQRLTNFDAGLSPETANNLSIAANKTFDDLFTPHFVPKQIYIYIASYHVLQFALLENDLKALRAKRNLMQLHPETAQREIETLDKQIAVIQQLLNYPDSKPAPVAGMENAPSSTHIHDFVDHSQKIHDYAERVKEFLRSIDYTIDDKITRKTWRVKSFLDVFTNKFSFGIPDHVKQIMKELKHFQDDPSDINAVVAFVNIGFIFSRLKSSWLRHPETTQFIKDQMHQIEDLHFLAPPVEVRALEASVSRP